MMFLSVFWTLRCWSIPHSNQSIFKQGRAHNIILAALHVNRGSLSGHLCSALSLSFFCFFMLDYNLLLFRVCFSVLSRGFRLFFACFYVFSRFFSLRSSCVAFFSPSDSPSVFLFRLFFLAFAFAGASGAPLHTLFCSLFFGALGSRLWQEDSKFWHPVGVFDFFLTCGKWDKRGFAILGLPGSPPSNGGLPCTLAALFLTPWHCDVVYLWG